MRRMLYFIELINFSVKVFAATKGGVISFYGYTPIEESCIYYINKCPLQPSGLSYSSFIENVEEGPRQDSYRTAPYGVRCRHSQHPTYYAATFTAR